MWRRLAMIYAAICAKCMAFRYRSAVMPDDTQPMPDDFEVIAPQVTPAAQGQKATCDACHGDLKFVKGADWESLMGMTRGQPSGNGHPGRMRIAPSAGGIWEVFKADAGEEVREMRDLAGGRLLILTSKRLVVVDPNLVGQEV